MRGICCVAGAMLAVASCSSPEKERLKSENELLRKQVALQEQLIARKQRQQPLPASGMVEVPSVVGCRVEEACAMVERAGLIVRLESPVCDMSLADGSVARQFPAGRTALAPGSHVSIWPNSVNPSPSGEVVEYSSGSEQRNETEDLVVVPDLQGCDRSAAHSRLEGAGLRLGTVKFFYNPYGRAGIVKQQEPGAGDRVRKGGAVTVWLNTEFAQ